IGSAQISRRETDFLPPLRPVNDLSFDRVIPAQQFCGVIYSAFVDHVTNRGTADNYSIHLDRFYNAHLESVCPAHTLQGFDAALTALAERIVIADVHFPHTDLLMENLTRKIFRVLVGKCTREVGTDDHVNA